MFRFLIQKTFPSDDRYEIRVYSNYQSVKVVMLLEIKESDLSDFEL